METLVRCRTAGPEPGSAGQAAGPQRYQTSSSFTTTLAGIISHDEFIRWAIELHMREQQNRQYQRLALGASKPDIDYQRHQGVPLPVLGFDELKAASGAASALSNSKPRCSNCVRSREAMRAAFIRHRSRSIRADGTS